MVELPERLINSWIKRDDFNVDIEYRRIGLVIAHLDGRDVALVNAVCLATHRAGHKGQ
jgi:hypothetical protein